jgi:hypothetical protein
MTLLQNSMAVILDCPENEIRGIKKVTMNRVNLTI